MCVRGYIILNPVAMPSIQLACHQFWSYCIFRMSRSENCQATYNKFTV